ncbi:MAG: hypothetical protein ABSC37_11460 [Xanthobacteraceae bacterium]
MIARSGGTAWFPADAPPALVLFVSHRWLSPSDPDPDGVQIRALQRLLAMIVSAAFAMREPTKSRVEILPSLMEHGVIQAAFLLGATANKDNMPVWESWSRFWRAVEHFDDDSLGSALLKNIGFWYDYSCLPQSIFANIRDGQAPGFSEGQTALFRLHELAAACPLLILRSRHDDYESRAWCSAELAMGHRPYRHLVLRTDLLGQPISPSDLLSPQDDTQGAWPGRRSLVGRLAEWETGINPLSKSTSRSLWDPWWIFLHWQDLAELEEQRAVPLLTTPRPPNIFQGQRQFMVTMMGLLDTCSEQDFADKPIKYCDLRGVVIHALNSANLTCSEQADMVFVGLTILHARHAGAPEFAQFYDHARRRLLQGETLRLSRYRERRGVTLGPHGKVESGQIHEARVWYLFEDETLDARPPPQWAR